MKNIRLPRMLLVLAALLAVSLPALAQQTPAPAEPKPAPTIPMAPLATQLGQTLQTLVESAAPPAENEEQISDTFATGLLNTFAKVIEKTKQAGAPLADYATAGKDFTDWVNRQKDSHRIALWNAIGHDLLIIVGTPLLFGLAALLFLIPLRMNIKRNKPKSAAGRLGLLIGLLFLRLIPVLIFLGGSLFLLEQNEVLRLPRFVILNVIYAVSLGYLIQQVLRFAFAPTTAHLRLFPLPTKQAVSAYRWLSAFCFIIVYSYFLIDVATVLRLPSSSIAIFQNFFALVLTVMAVIVIFRSRAKIAAILQGSPEEKDQAKVGHVLRNRLAQNWHNFATGYLVIFFIITLLRVENGLALMLRGTIFSVFLLFAARLGFIALEKWKAQGGDASLTHRQVLSFLFRPIIWIATFFAMAEVWGFNLAGFFAAPLGQRVLSALISITVTLLVLTLLYEALSAWIARHLNKTDSYSKKPVASARARTLLPMLRNSIFILFSGVAILMSLSAMGFNIAPLLAGAGVVGVAIGFGSQTLVKDFLTGLFIVAENAIAVGDTVKIDRFSGAVEALSIRTIRLRDGDGSLHILPFGQVSQITNMTRDFAYAQVDIGVAYDTNLELASETIRKAGALIQEDPLFKRVVLEPAEVLGVEALGDFSITLRARIKTRPGKQWDVKRLFLLRIKQLFDEARIEIPFPTATRIIHDNKQG